ncbi:hypothetical protein J2128_000625 [Methanomicrobium sp. W14]|uniref:hypothetical protein n=1 Tax=Methanomicrobium sp. W14 TaxID=2817839 RepID=UPI001AE47D16|nr:hypothetical protein [Methanomicrobium sp. W14]MBP2132704.1 hypothetical protein [Methanomicrobium sp. W14]
MKIAGAVVYSSDVLSLIPKGGRLPRVTGLGNIVDKIEPYQILLRSSESALEQDKISDDSDFTVAGVINWDPVWGPCHEEE